MKNLLKQFKSFKRGFRAFLIRVVVFLVTYRLISFFYSDWKDSLDQSHYALQNGYLSFFIYFVTIILVAIRWKSLKKIPYYKNSILQTVGFVLFAAGLYSISAGWLAAKLDLKLEVAYFSLYTLGGFSIFLAVFNLKFLMKLFQEEILFVLMITILYMSSHLLVDQFWPKFFWPIAASLNFVLPLMADDVMIAPIAEGFTVKMNDFQVNVGPPCAGVYSMIAFALLFLTAVFFAQKHREFSRGKTIVAFFAGLTVMYVLNILRISIIIFVGAFYSRELAIDLFHEYLSAIFLMATFLVYLNVIIPRISVPRKTK